MTPEEKKHLIELRAQVAMCQAMLSALLQLKGVSVEGIDHLMRESWKKAWEDLHPESDEEPPPHPRWRIG